MARDDYFLMVYRILSYLYRCIRNGKQPDEEYLRPQAKDFPIEYGYWSYIWENMVKDGLVENVSIVPVDGAEPLVRLQSNTRITPNGIEYLQENSIMKKTAKFIGNVITTIRL